MRRTKWGLAAAVVACMVGFGGTAQAGPTYVTLVNGNTLSTSGGVSWYVNDCIYNGGGCSNLVMSPNGSGITISASGGGALSSLVEPGVSDFTLDIYEYTGSFGSGPFTLSFASVSSVGSTGGGTVSISPSNGSGGVIGWPGNGSFPPYLSLTASNYVEYAGDVPLTSALTSVSLGVPVPEPASFGLLAFALLAVAAIRFRPVR
ncbi:MAG: hypothetical protein HIU82_13430 [Proteobacteria bacterium]|nr:hypothetical protein [Pseudomonadota bacterium]